MHEFMRDLATHARFPRQSKCKEPKDHREERRYSVDCAAVSAPAEPDLVRRVECRPRRGRSRHPGIPRLTLSAVPLFGIALFGAFLAACGAPPDSPEDRVRAFLGRVEESAEGRSLADFRDYLAEDYHDHQGNGRREAFRLLAAQFLRNQSLHLISRIREIRITSPGEAEAVILVGMAGSPLTGPEQIGSLSADVYRFELALREESGQIQVYRARWQPALAAELGRPP